MATGTVSPAPGQGAPRANPPGFGAVIDRRLDKTRRQVKTVDLSMALMTLAAGDLLYLWLGALVDHWLVFGGLGMFGRMAFWSGLVLGGGWYFVRHVLPPIIRRVNPVYAAQTIEEGRPTLKNSLINFLMVRKHREEVAPIIYRALEHRAAADLTLVPAETAVDRSGVIHRGYALAVVVAIVMLYFALSPKSPWTSFERLMFPWADVQAPTRVEINRVEPGDVSAYHGDFLTISADVTGLREGEAVLLYYTTADNQSVDQAVPLTAPEEGICWRGSIPPGSLGLQQDLQYYLVAGDCRTRPFKVDVLINPVIVVDRVDYHYPAYTGIPDRSIEHEGDLRAIEGTQITLHATANQEIARNKATVDLDCSGKPGLRMKTDGATATAQFTLHVKQEDPTQPEFNCYRLRFTDAQNRPNRQPIRYRVEVIRDKPPEVEIVEPTEEEVQVAAGGEVEIRVRASDDYGLRRVAVPMEQKGQRLAIPPLPDWPMPQPPWKDKFQGAYRFRPAQFGLHAGDHVVYWAEAEDNKADGGQPQPNHRETARRRIAIVDGAAAQSPPQTRARQEQPAKNDSDNNPNGQPAEGKHPGDQGPPSGNQPGQPPKEDRGPQDRQPQTTPPNTADQASPEKNTPNEPGQNSSAAGSEGSPQNPGDQSSGKQDQGAQQPADPNNPGEAFEKIEKFNQEQQKQSQDGKQQSSGEKQSGGEQSSGEKQSGGGQQSGGEKQSGGGQQSGGEKQSGGGQQSGGEKQSAGGQQSGGEKQSGGGQQSAGEKQSGGGQQSGGEKQSGGGQQSAGEKQSGGGQQSGGEKQSGGGQQSGGEKQSGGGQQSGGEKQSAGGQPKPGGQPQSGAQPQTSGQKEPGGPPQSSGRPEPGDQRLPGVQGQPGQNSGIGQGDKSQGPSGLDKQTPKPQAMPGASPQTGGQREEPGGTAGHGKPSNEQSGSPASQESNQPRSNNPGSGKPETAKSDPASEGQSPSISHKQSNSQGDAAGDRSGGGEKGGGQRSKQEGTGTAGTSSASEQGGSKSNQQGEGETGTKAGNQAVASKPTGSSSQQKDAEGTHSGPDAGQSGASGSAKDSSSGTGGRKSDSDTADVNPASGATGSSQGKGGRAAGNPMTGGLPGNGPFVPPAEESAANGEAPNLAYTAKQVDMVLESLKEQLAKEKPDPELLKRLGWTRQDLENFYKQWDQMRRAAAHGQRDNAARKDYQDALRSLGLTPHGTYLEGGKSQRDQERQLHDAHRSAPPPSWAPLLKAYTEGVAGQK